MQDKASISKDDEIEWADKVKKLLTVIEVGAGRAGRAETPHRLWFFLALASGNVIYEQLRLVKMRQYFHVKLDVSSVSACTLSLVEKMKDTPAFWATACFFWRVCVSSSCVD